MKLHRILYWSKEYLWGVNSKIRIQNNIISKISNFYHKSVGGRGSKQIFSEHNSTIVEYGAL